jgi:hypothetical protein
MENKYLLFTDTREYKIEKSNLIYDANLFTKAFKDFVTIVGSSKVEFNQGALDSFISSKTGYSNIKASAELLDVAREYSNLTYFFDKNIDIDQFEWSKENGRYEPKETVLNDLKARYSSYVKDEFKDVYDDLMGLITILNKNNNTSFASALQQNYKREWFIDKNKFATIQQMIK